MNKVLGRAKQQNADSDQVKTSNCSLHTSCDLTVNECVECEMRIRNRDLMILIQKGGKRIAYTLHNIIPRTYPPQKFPSHLPKRAPSSVAPTLTCWQSSERLVPPTSSNRGRVQLLGHSQKKRRLTCPQHCFQLLRKRQQKHVLRVHLKVPEAGRFGAVASVSKNCLRRAPQGQSTTIVVHQQETT